MAKLAAVMMALAVAAVLAPSMALTDPKFSQSDFLIDLRKKLLLNSAGGKIYAADLANTPVLDSALVTFVRADLVNGGIVPVHFHPRADEGFFVLTGEIYACFAEETGGRTICNHYPTGTAGIFPQGTIHFQMAMNGPASLIAFLNSNDGGLTLLPYQELTLPTEVLAAAYNTTTDDIKAITARLPAPPFV